MSDENEVILTTCPRDCYDACGIAVIKRNGVITRVRGDPNNPVNRGSLCGKCAIAYNGIVRDPGERVQTPLRRVGPKGTSQFQPVSWDEAIETTAVRLQEIVVRNGPQAIVNAHYSGTMSLIAFAFPLRFFNRLGAVEVEPDSICNLAGQVALQYTVGNPLLGFDPRTAKDADCIVVWGANPHHSAPCGTWTATCMSRFDQVERRGRTFTSFSGFPQMMDGLQDGGCTCWDHRLTIRSVPRNVNTKAALHSLACL